jgi:hypothetical protein
MPIRATLIPVLGCALTLAGCGDAPGGGAQCCALQSYCSACECQHGEAAIADSSNEEVCKQVNDFMLERGAGCYSYYSADDRSFTDFLASCVDS